MKAWNVIAACAAAATMAAGGVNAADPESAALNDAQLSVAWSGGPLLIPNRTAVVVGEDMPVCDDAGELCDRFTLDVNLSQELRNNSGNRFPTVEVTVGWDGEGDLDVYVHAPDGTLVTYAYTGSNPERLYIPLDEMPNGSYTITMVPYTPIVSPYEGQVEVTGVAGKSSSSVFGAAMDVRLLGLLALAGLLPVVRRRSVRGALVE